MTAGERAAAENRSAEHMLENERLQTQQRAAEQTRAQAEAEWADARAAWQKLRQAHESIQILCDRLADAEQQRRDWQDESMDDMPFEARLPGGEP